MYVPTINYSLFFSLNVLNYLGVNIVCSKINQISTCSLLSPFIFYNFSVFRLLGLLCFTPSRYVRFLVVLGSNFEASGLPFGLLASDLFRLGVHFGPFLLDSFWFLLASFGSLLAPFGFLLASFWLRLASVCLPLVPFGFP